MEKQEVADFIHAVRNPSEAYVDKPGSPAYAPMDFAIKVDWKGMTMPLFLVEGNLLDLVHLSNGFRVLPDTEPLKVGNALEVTSRIHAVRIMSSGKMVEVCGTISRDSVPSCKSLASFFTVELTGISTRPLSGSQR